MEHGVNGGSVSAVDASMRQTMACMPIPGSPGFNGGFKPDYAVTGLIVPGTLRFSEKTKLFI